MKLKANYFVRKTRTLLIMMRSTQAWRISRRMNLRISNWKISNLLNTMVMNINLLIIAVARLLLN